MFRSTIRKLKDEQINIQETTDTAKAILVCNALSSLYPKVRIRLYVDDMNSNKWMFLLTKKNGNTLSFFARLSIALKNIFNYNKIAYYAKEKRVYIVFRVPKNSTMDTKTIPYIM